MKKFKHNQSKRNRAVIQQYKDKKCHYWPLVKPCEVEFTNAEYHIAMLRRFLAPVHTLNTPYYGCRSTQNVDPYGDHAIICPSGSSTKRRHNKIQHTLFLMGRRAGHDMDKEVSCVHHSAKVPADLFYHNYNNGKHLAVDVSFVSCTNSSHINESFEEQGIAATSKLKKKFNKYKNETFYLNVEFAPFIIEEFGLLHPTAREIFNELCTRIAFRHNQPIEQVKFKWGRIINAQIMLCNSQAILLKCDTLR